MTEQVALDLALCKACGICIALCPEKVFDVDRQRYPVVARPGSATNLPGFRRATRPRRQRTVRAL